MASVDTFAFDFEDLPTPTPSFSGLCTSAAFYSGEDSLTEVNSFIHKFSSAM